MCPQTEILEMFKSCGGAVWTDLEIPAGIDRKDHVENCRTDGNRKNLGYGWYIQGCTSMISIAFYHPCLCGEYAGASTSINKAAVLSVNLYPQRIIRNFEIAPMPLC
ncbi:conserved hypothetical protein [Trichinella spiralis]|uniref:hypothetical protein n=1 Tax=Trichinella spiralis TaxID=6334 RepID=UPI0001EFD597|nr:conserved hypothetical protein [Trichinella spiralis]